MKVAVQLGGGVLVARIDRMAPALAPAMVAATVARAVERALVGRAANTAPPPHVGGAVEHGRDQGASAGSARSDASAGSAPVDDEQDVDEQQDRAEQDGARAGGDEHGAVRLEAVQLDGDDGDDGDALVRADELRRREALALLDDGVPEAQVCTRLAVSRGQLRRWDARAHDDALAGALASARFAFPLPCQQRRGGS